MGRPIKKKWFGNPDSAGYQLKLSAKFKNSSNVSVSGEAFIVKQCGTRKYLVDIDGDQGIVFLVNKNSVPSLVDGEAYMLLDVDGAIEPVSKLTQHRAVTWKAGGGYGSYIWTKEMLADEVDEGNVTPVDTVLTFVPAEATFTVLSGEVSAVTIVEAGSGYVVSPDITSADDLDLVFTSTVADGEVATISVVDPVTTLADGTYPLTIVVL